MKAGANRTDMISIKNLAAAGETADFISSSLQIELSVVEAFVNKEGDSNKKGKKSKLADSFES